VEDAINSGARTSDLGGNLKTRQMADEIIKRM
jgi:isocitrate/isopropylmalate dehydrogenase